MKQDDCTHHSQMDFIIRQPQLHNKLYEVLFYVHISRILQLMEVSLKQKKRDIDSISCLTMKLDGTSEGHICRTVDHLNSEWAARESKVW